VSKAFIESLEGRSYLDLVRAGLSFTDAGSLLKADARVFLKPNLTFPTYRPGVMTSIEAVEAAIVALKDYTPHITVGDSDSGGYNPFSMKKVYDEIGMYDLGARYDVDVVNLSDLPRRSVPLGGGKRPIPLDLPTLLTDEIDLLVTMPVPKIHMNTGVSLTFKNQWGCIPEPKDRLRLHPQFARVIFEVNRAIQARVAIVDGRWGLDVTGPMQGNPVPLNWVLVTDDLGAGARICCDLMGIPMQRVGHLRYAERRGAIPRWADIDVNQSLAPFRAEPFHLRRKWTDYPGLFAFHNRALAYLAYFSPLASFLHKLLYLFREPFYDYGENPPEGGDERG
jgi:uncharacterized protein (DUF362 family)